MIEIAEEVENRFFVSCYWPFPFHASIPIISSAFTLLARCPEAMAAIGRDGRPHWFVASR